MDRTITNSTGAAAGSAFLLGGVLLYAAQLLTVLLPAPPGAPARLLSWVEQNRLPIAASNELFMFAVLCLLPAVIVLWRTIKTRETLVATAGCAIFLLAITLLSVLVMVEGRLVYPVYGLELTADAANLAVSLLFGGLHASTLLFGLAMLLLGFAMRHERRGRALASVSYAAGLFQLLGAYPWLTPVWFNVAVASAMWIWTAVVGACLLMRDPKTWLGLQ